MEPTRDVFVRKLGALINELSLENGSNTPDFILAEYLASCLDNWNRTSKMREGLSSGDPRVMGTGASRIEDTSKG